MKDLFLLFFLILFISMISQIGDLIISYFKRKAKLKDTGKIIPGHGGLLDRIDGMIFVFPIFYLISIIYEKKNCNFRFYRFYWQNINRNN